MSYTAVEEDTPVRRPQRFVTSRVGR